MAAAQGRCERAAEIDGAREFLGVMTGVMLPPIHRSGYARTLATFRAGLDLAALDAARAWGDDMVPPEQFIRLTARR